MLSPIEMVFEAIIEIIGANIYEPFSNFIDKLFGRKTKNSKRN